MIKEINFLLKQLPLSLSLSLSAFQIIFNHLLHVYESLHKTDITQIISFII